MSEPAKETTPAKTEATETKADATDAKAGESDAADAKAGKSDAADAKAGESDAKSKPKGLKFPAKPAGKFALGSKFGGAFGKTTPKAPAEKAAAAGKEEALDDSHTEAPSSSADQADPDEGEETLFTDKAMLYRFDQANSEWKERGVGFMKILRNKVSKKCRVLMRRNQTFRVCANHFILPLMELKANNGSDRALMWTAVDFADGTESHDVLSVKFKNAEVATAFKKAFEDGKAQNKALLETKKE